MLPAIISAASLGIISVASAVVYKKTNDVQSEINTKMKTLVDQVNTSQYYNYEIEQKEQEGIFGLNNNASDIRKSYMSKDALNENVTTHQLNINTINQTNGSISISGNDWQSGAMQFNYENDSASVDPDYLIQRGIDNLKNRIVINAPNVNGAGVNITSTSNISHLSVDTNTGIVNVQGNSKTSKLQLGGKWTLSGVGDSEADDTWLRFFDSTGTDYYGGIATLNSSNVGTSYMNIAQVNQLTSTGGPNNSNWINVQHDSGNVKIGADKNNRGISSEGSNLLNVYTNGKQGISFDQNADSTFYGNINVPNGTINSQHYITALNGAILNNQVDSGAGRGLNLWGGNDNRYGIWTSTPGNSKGMNGAAAGDDLTGASVRFSTANSATSGFMFQNSDGKPLTSIRGSDGRLNAYGDVNVTGNATVNGTINKNGGNYGSINTNKSVSANNVTIGNKWTLGADPKNDSWLNLYDAAGKNYYGGLATQNSSNIGNSYMNNAQVNNITSIGTAVGNSNWMNIQKTDGNLRFGSDDASRGLWSDGQRDTSIYTNGKAQVTVKPDGTVNIPGALNVARFSAQVVGAPANNYISTDLSDGTNWLTIKRNDGNINLGTDGKNMRGITSDGDKNFNIYTSSTPRVTVTKAGNVGINNPSPNNPLDVTGNVNSGSLTTGAITTTKLTANNVITSGLTVNGNGSSSGTIDAANLTIGGQGVATQAWTNTKSTPQWNNVQGKPDLLGDGVNVWETSTDHKNRFYFSNNDKTIFGSPNNGYMWANNTNNSVGTLDNSGTFSAAGDIKANANLIGNISNANNTASISSGTITGNVIHSKGALQVDGDLIGPNVGKSANATDWFKINANNSGGAFGTSLYNGLAINAGGGLDVGQWNKQPQGQIHSDYMHSRGNIQIDGNSVINGTQTINGDSVATSIGRSAGATDWFRINPKNSITAANPGTAIFNGLAINEGGGLDVGQWNKQPQGQMHGDYLHSRGDISIDGTLKTTKNLCIGNTCINEADIQSMIRVDSLDCAVSGWGTCSTTCGGGTQTRTVTTPQRGRGADCPTLSQSCNPQPCPIDCKVSDWSSCTANCGGGTQTRTITRQPQYGGAACPALSQTCNTQHCPVDCSYTTYYDDCTASCGGGTQNERISITAAASYGGSCSYANGQKTGTTRQCNTGGCPVNCQGYWGGWSGCSRSCDGGQMTNTYYISQYQQNGGAACPYYHGYQQSQYCNNGDCYRPIWSYLRGSYVVDIEGASGSAGANAHMWDWWGGNNQKWYHDGANRFVVNHSGQCMDASGAGTDNGTQVIQWPCHDGANQKWRWYGASLRPDHATWKCLDVAWSGTGNGTQLRLWDCNGSSAQNWSY